MLMKSKRKRERENSLSRYYHHRRERMNGDPPPSMFSNKLILPSQKSQLQCLEMSCQCVNIVQGDVNTVFRHLATLVHSKPARESFIPSGRTPRVTGILLNPSGRIPGIKGLIPSVAWAPTSQMQCWENSHDSKKPNWQLPHHHWVWW